MRITPWGLVACLLLALVALGQTARADATIVERFLSRDDAALQGYEARRSMRARNGRFNKEAWLEAETRLDPISGFSYEVVASGGSSMIIDRVLIPALRGEADMWRTRVPERYGLTSDNYAFAALPSGPGDASEVRVSIEPYQQHLLLVSGVLILSPADADLLRVEGRVSKSPSFWVSRIDVVRRYARIHGIRVPVALRSVAHVRLAGRSEMQADYHYVSVNGYAITPASEEREP